MSKRERWLVAIALSCVTAIMLASGALQAGTGEGGPRVDVWTDRGAGAIYRAGDPVEIHMRPDQDCYVIVYEIDTDGYLRLLFPEDCRDDGFVVGGRTYIVGGAYNHRYAGGPAGVDYIHVLASYEPFRQLYWHGCDGYSAYAQEVSWSGFHDYWGSALPPRIYGDPYMAMQTIDEFVCLDALESGLIWADFTYFYVGQHVSYPRYLCYDCHGFDTRIAPYADACVGFSISFVDCDPLYRPWSWWWWSAGSYCGPRFVCRAIGHHECGPDCDHHDGRGHRHDHDGAWPSEYKWKSRSDDVGRIVRGLPDAIKSEKKTVAVREMPRSTKSEKKAVAVREMPRSTKSERATIASKSVTPRKVEVARKIKALKDEVARVFRGEHRDGNLADDVRVEAKEAAVEREAAQGKRDSNDSKVRARSQSTSSKDQHADVRAKSSKAESRAESRIERTPQVRRGNQGKSPSARRALSR